MARWSWGIRYVDFLPGEENRIKMGTESGSGLPGGTKVVSEALDVIVQ